MKHDCLSLVQHLMQGQSLSEAEARQLFGEVVAGNVDDILLAAALAAIKARSHTPGELAGAALALLDSATPFPRPDYRFADIVGTGGDGHNTINLSTIAAITAATCNVKIIKHGNRSISSVSGSFDLLEKLGVPLQVTPRQSRQQVDQYGLCFLFAPQYHAGVRHAANVRRSLRTRTIFNLLGPLVNPARPPCMLLGVADPALLFPVATVLSRLGCQSALVVHGSGLDEVAVHGPTSVVHVLDGNPELLTLQPRDFGTDTWPLEELVCQQAGESHQRSVAVLGGQGRPAENAAVCVNVALLLKLFGQHDLKNNFAMAMQSLLEGRSLQLVRQLAEEAA
jgi:anthranilate phosphoribosyltransferase